MRLFVTSYLVAACLNTGLLNGQITAAPAEPNCTKKAEIITVDHKDAHAIDKSLEWVEGPLLRPSYNGIDSFAVFSFHSSVSFLGLRFHFTADDLDQENALLMFLGNDGDLETPDFIALTLQKGAILFSINLGHGE